MFNSIAGIETMFSSEARQYPWQDLGKNVCGELNSSEAIIKAGLDWNVIQKPIYTIDIKGQGPFPILDIPNYIANIRDKDGKVLGIVSNKYQVIQNIDAFRFTDELLRENVVYETAGSIDDGKRIWLLAKMPDIYRIFGDDDIEPYIVFTNTHDGSGAVRVALTPIRVWCKNTLNLALKNAKRCWSMVHVGNLSKKMDDARETLFHAKEYMNNLRDELQRLNRVMITVSKVKEIVEYLFPYVEDASDEQKKNTNEKRENLLYRFENAIDLNEHNVPKSYYRMINAVSDYVTHQDLWNYKSGKKTISNYEEKYRKAVERNFVKTIDGYELLNKAYNKILGLI